MGARFPDLVHYEGIRVIWYDMKVVYDTSVFGKSRRNHGFEDFHDLISTTLFRFHFSEHNEWRGHEREGDAVETLKSTVGL